MMWREGNIPWNKGLIGEKSHMFGKSNCKGKHFNLGENNPMFGKPSPMRGKNRSEEFKLKDRLAHLGKKINLSEEVKEKKRVIARKNLEKVNANHRAYIDYASPDRSRKISESIKLRWADPEWKERVLKKVFASNDQKPNKAEMAITSIIQDTLPGEYIFSGNGKIFIGGKCPDWFNINGKKKLIELFGNYFHGEVVTGRTKVQEEKQRSDHFAKYGFSTLFIWESELKDRSCLAQKIVDFNKI